MKGKLDPESFILNCVPSTKPEQDWTFADAVEANLVDTASVLPASCDLRASWWKIDNQGSTGACVGFAAAYGVLRWHYVQQGLLKTKQKPSARFIWMANKETDQITSYPTTFLESEGTQTKLALNIARKYGCVPDSYLPMNGSLAQMSRAQFYAKAAQYRIASFHSLKGLNSQQTLSNWRRWLCNEGPILTRLNVEGAWDSATSTNGVLKTYDSSSVRGGHAVCIVGYEKKHFIVRNSWGTTWGDGGFAYASESYAKKAFKEGYGVKM